MRLNECVLKCASNDAWKGNPFVILSSDEKWEFHSFVWNILRAKKRKEKREEKKTAHKRYTQCRITYWMRWLMVVDMFALGQIKLSYQLNGHTRKDIFNFCFISIVNRVLQIVSTCLKSFLYCFARFVFLFFVFFLFVSSTQTVSFYSRESFASSTHMLFDRRVIRQESEWCVRHLCSRDLRLDAEWEKAVQNKRGIFITFVFPRSFSSVFFLYFSVNARASVV